MVAGRWAKKLEELYSFAIAKVGDPYLTFELLSMAIESYFELHLFLENPRDYPSLQKGASQYYPKAESFLLGSQTPAFSFKGESSVGDQTSAHIALNLEKHGIKLFQLTQQEREESSLVQALPYKAVEWLRDCVFFTKGEEGQLITKLPNLLFDLEKAHRRVEKEQQVRQGGLKYEYGYMGTSKAHLFMLNMAAFHYQHFGNRCQNMHMLWSYAEGGNLYLGQEADGTNFMLIGNDSVEIIRSTLQEELKGGAFVKSGEKWSSDPSKETSDPEVDNALIKAVLKRDYGIRLDKIYFIEQPHKFHLDMGLAFVGPKKIILNDSVEAFKVGLELFKDEKQPLPMPTHDWNRFLEKQREDSQKKKELEDQTAQDLIEAGFTVERVPGSFMNLYAKGPTLHQVNFFNFITFQTPQEPSQNVVYAVGCPPKFKKLFEDIIEGQAQQKPDAIYYLTEEESCSYLANGGGINCLTQILETRL